MKVFRRFMIFSILLTLPLFSFGKTLYVSKKTGKNKNPGTRELPLKNIDKAIKKAAPGDTINVANGVYKGTFDIGYIEINKPLQLYGSFTPDFSKRDIKMFPTIFQPDNKSGAKSRKPLVKFSGNIQNITIDGFIFDMGQRNAYHKVEGKPLNVDTGMLLLPPKKMTGQVATVTESCLSIPSSAMAKGENTIQNNIFINGAKFGIQAGVRNGILKIFNNVFVANRMAAIEVYGTCRSKGGPKSPTQCGKVEVAFNTILLSWSRTKDLGDMGYGIRIMTKLKYNIHHNIIGGNILAGIDHTRFNPDEWIKIDKNIFFVNKQADLDFSPSSNTRLNLMVSQFEDLEISSAEGNMNKIPRSLPVDKAYLEGFLNASYTEKKDFDNNSPANQWRELLGVNKRGKLISKVTMFANRYPLKQAIKLFGAVKGFGAQFFK